MKQVVDAKDFPIPLSRAAAMRLIMDHVGSGHSYWASGVVVLDRAEAFVSKMLPLGVGLDSDRRTRARHPKSRLKYPNPVGVSTHLVLYPGPDPRQPEAFTWFLLSTGSLPNERLFCQQDQRLVWGEYELFRWVRPRKIGGREVWSWRFTAVAEGELLAKFQAAARQQQPFALKKLLYGLRQRPGWGGLRQQSLAFYKAAKNAARARGAKADKFIAAQDWSLPGEYSSLRYWRAEKEGGVVRLGDVLGQGARLTTRA